MVRESLLSNLSPRCDERTLREHVKHHTPEQLSVSVSNSEPHPHNTGCLRGKKGQGLEGEGDVHKPNERGQKKLYMQLKNVDYNNKT